MMKGFFSPKNVVEHSFNGIILYKSTHNNKECTKISSSNSIDKGDVFDVLQKLKLLYHPNLAPIYRITKHSVFTKKLYPFSKDNCSYNDSFLSGNKNNKNNKKASLSKEYKEYFIFKIKEVVEFLHTNNFYSQKLTIDDFFIDSCGNPVLFNFFNLNFIEDPEKKTMTDILSLNSLSLSITRKSLKVLEIPEFFKELEEKMKKFSENLTNFEKIEFLDKIEENKNLLNIFIKRNIFSFSLEELKGKWDKEYKIALLVFLKEFSDSLFIENQDEFFKIMDSNVRMYLLTNIEYEGPLDKSVDDISLGLRVKDEKQRLITLTFIFNNEDKFSKKSMDQCVNIMANNVNDQKSIEMICDHFTNKDYKSFSHLYKMIYSFLKTKKAIGSVYNCIQKYFKNFDNYKICSELLPFLCSRLSEKEEQEKCFLLVEGIVKHLKENKEFIENKEWGISKVKGLLKKALSSKDKNELIEEKIKEIKSESEWDDQDL